MPDPGFFILHDAAVPDLVAGDYVLHVDHRIDVPGEPADPIPPRDTHIEITGPRFIMPPDQILSTFPPNQSQGAYSSRLPQIVLRRRTLPWERRHPSQPDTVPWLALVVIADGEGELRPDVPVAQCVTPGVALTGPRDAEKGTALRVTETVVQRVFPGRDEVALLAHLREVDINDTELILGDDDGWMAVVVANRLPQPGIRYRVCLISLEGQLDRLPVGADIPVVDRFNVHSVYPDLTTLLQAGHVTAAIAAASGENKLTVRNAGRASARTAKDAWSESKLPPPERTGAAGYVREGRLTGLQVAAVELEWLHPIERILVFPVLAHWTFTCSEAGDFESRMRQLHVGLHGTLKPPTPPPPGKPAPPRTRETPTTLATGHVALDSITREGDPETVWYRGPFSPRPGTRTARTAAGLVPILHVSDQARRIGPDGREDVSLAIAFEIGRLLALAESSIVVALLRWRRDAFAIARASSLLERDPRISALLEGNFLALPQFVTNELLLSLGANDARLIGVPRPIVDPGVEFMPLDNLDIRIAQGFGLRVENPAAGPPDVVRVADPREILANGVAGLGHIADALKLTREEIVSFASERAKGLKP